jgi:next-to-BRCA1 protein 1
LLEIPENQTVVFERYSDSAASYVTLDAANTQVYKTLFRAAKAKGKLRLRATVNGDSLSNLLPSFNQLGMPAKMAFASTFPEFVRFGSETTLNSTTTANTAAPTIVRSTPSVETLNTATSANMTGEEAQWAAPCGNTPRRSPTRLTRESYFNELANIARQREMAFRTKQPQAPMPAVCSSWSVFCNNCDLPMENEHYHCNVCDDGDYDLCEGCVNKGVHCPGESHWLIKRFVKNGHVINSTTETLVPKSKASPPPTKPEMPGAFTDEKKVDEEEYEEEEPSRTCNSCVKGEYLCCNCQN